MPPRSRWTSFLADPEEPRPRMLDAAEDAYSRLYAEERR
jgi:hypothetical protein